jgi:hypothetical protein
VLRHLLSPGRPRGRGGDGRWRASRLVRKLLAGTTNEVFSTKRLRKAKFRPACGCLGGGARNINRGS